MWLLDTSTLMLTEFVGRDVPPYLILSHVWESEELRFEEMQNRHGVPPSKAGLRKVEEFCKRAKERGFKYGWVDTCCIDKRSSAELTESINSMYRWYKDAAECLIYLSDVSPMGAMSEEDHFAQIRASRWFTRGWTLQELLANRERVFYAKDWSLLTLSSSTLCDLLERATGINRGYLFNGVQAGGRKQHLDACVAERMSWAARRKTTRPEDESYSLLGIFNINMPILYGEGAEKAFRRLQEEIMKRSFDQTLFAWRNNDAGNPQSVIQSGLLAPSPLAFADSPTFELWAPNMLSPCSITGVGVHFLPCVYKGKTDLPHGVILASLQCLVRTEEGWCILFIYLHRIEHAHWMINGEKVKAYRRTKIDSFVAIPNQAVADTRSIYSNVVVLELEHLRLVLSSLVGDMDRQARNEYGNIPKTLSLGRGEETGFGYQ